MTYKLYNGDATEILPTLADKSFDTILIDPPYGMGIDEWDTPVDIPFFTKQAKRLGREFYAVFGVMPYLREWDRQAELNGLHFLEHITWVKRVTTINRRLSRSHEDIYIYAIGDKRSFYQTKGRFEDVKVPGVSFDVVSIEGIKRYIADLWYHIKNGKARTNPDVTAHHDAYTRFDTCESLVCPEYVNFTNVWSFSPESRATFNKGGKFHPTMKPLKLTERLVEMLTAPNGSVLDFFSGSGTTAVACKRLGRACTAIELRQDYYDLSVERLNNTTREQANLFDEPTELVSHPIAVKPQFALF